MYHLKNDFLFLGGLLLMCCNFSVAIDNGNNQSNDVFIQSGETVRPVNKPRILRTKQAGVAASSTVPSDPVYSGPVACFPDLTSTLIDVGGNTSEFKLVDVDNYVCDIGTQDSKGIYVLDSETEEFWVQTLEALDSLDQPYLEISNAVLDDSSSVLIVQPGATLTVLDDAASFPVNGLGVRRQLGALDGNRNAIVLRVSASNGAAPSRTASQLAYDVFGIGSGDGNHLKGQLSNCSARKTQLVPATGTGVVNGVLEVSINIDLSNADKFKVQADAQTAAESRLGMALTQSNFKHVLFVLPPGVTTATANGPSVNWVAYGYVRGHRTAYNNLWGGALSAHMHEIGHNFGFSHDGYLTQEYGDKSGVMGYSYPGTDGPQMCYNGPKSFYSEWYADRIAYITNPSTIPWSGALVGVVDYFNGVSTAYTVVAKIDYVYVMFNRAKGFNNRVYTDWRNGSRKAVDPTTNNVVTVTEQRPASSGRLPVSNRQAVLNSNGDLYAIPNWSGSDSLVIKLCDFTLAYDGVGADYAHVLIYLSNGNDNSKSCTQYQALPAYTESLLVMPKPTESPVVRMMPIPRPTTMPPMQKTLSGTGTLCTKNIDCQSSSCKKKVCC